MDFTAASPPPEIGSIACDAASTDALADDRSRIAQSVTKTVHAETPQHTHGPLAQAWENRENANKNVKKAKWRREQDQA